MDRQKATIMDRDFSLLIVLLLVAGCVLLGTSIHGTFIIDELNYMVTAIGVRDGTLAAPYTQELPPGKELHYFDPEANYRTAIHGRVVSLVPPLYSLLAAPLLLIGWHGLVLLNVLSFLATTAIVFLVTRRYATEKFTPWLAAILFFFGGYGVEYAQAVWPHMVATFFCSAAVFFASSVWHNDVRWKAFFAGVFCGISAGIREQNIFFALCIGIVLLLFGHRRLRSSFMFSLGIALPLLAIMVFNHQRYGNPNPFPKAAHYVRQVETEMTNNSPISPFEVLWVKVFEFSAQPTIEDPVHSATYARSATTGAILVGSAVKKALLQSSPWIGLALTALIAAWIRKQSSAEYSTLFRALSLVVLPTIAMFTLAGYGRMDGMAYNQRYFHELVPLAAIVAALTMDKVGISKKHLVIGCLSSIGLFLFLLLYSAWDVRHIVILKYPLILAVLAVVFWMMRNGSSKSILVSLSVGLCVGWSFAVHLGDDVVASRKRRTNNAQKLEVLNTIIPQRSALFTYWGAKDAAGPLQITKDVVILDAWADEGKDGVMLKDLLREQTRKIFLVEQGMPSTVLSRIVENDSLVTKSQDPYVVYELVKREGKPGEGTNQ